MVETNMELYSRKELIEFIINLIGILFCSYGYYWFLKEIILLVIKKPNMGLLKRVLLFLSCFLAIQYISNFTISNFRIIDRGKLIPLMLNNHFVFLSFVGSPFIAGLIAFNLFQKSKNINSRSKMLVKYLIWLEAIVLFLAGLLVWLFNLFK